MVFSVFVSKLPVHLKIVLVTVRVIVKVIVIVKVKVIVLVNVQRLSR